MDLIQKSIQASLDIQILTGLGSAFAYLYKFNDANEKTVLLELLSVELQVQAVEAFFYQYVLLDTQSSLSTSLLRYGDWFLTTPVMLVQFARYLDYLNGDTSTSFKAYFFKNEDFFRSILVANGLMLLTGVMAERGVMPRPYSTIVGFLFFFKIFSDLNSLARTQKGQQFIKTQAIIWSLYGLADLFKRDAAQVVFSGLDLISKNSLGVFFSVELLK